MGMARMGYCRNLAILEMSSECKRLWLLKNSHSRSSQKFHRARMPYKRRSRFWCKFSILRLGQFFQKQGFFSSHRLWVLKKYVNGTSYRLGVCATEIFLCSSARRWPPEVDRVLGIGDANALLAVLNSLTSADANVDTDTQLMMGQVLQRLHS